MLSRPVVLLAIGQLTCWAGLYYSFPALLLHLERANGWARGEITLAMTIALVVAAVLSPAAGRTIDAGYGHRLLPVSAALGALALAIMPSARTLAQFYLIWALMGAAMAGALYEPCFALIIRHLRGQAARAIAFITLIAGFASTISFPLGNRLAECCGPNLALYAFALLVLGIGVPCLWRGAAALAHSPPPASSHLAPPPMPPYNPVPYHRQRRFWLLTASFTLATMVQGVMLNHLLPLLRERDLADAQAILLLTLLGPFQVFGRIVWLLLSARTTPATAMTGCLLTMLGALFLLLFAAASWPVLLLFMALLSSSFGIFAILKPLTIRHYMGDAGFGAMNGIMSVPLLLGFALAPVLGSLVWSQAGYPSLNRLLIAMTGLALLLYLAAGRRG